MGDMGNTMGGAQEFGFRSVATDSDSLVQPLETPICPACYAERDQKVPVVSFGWWGATMALPDGERIPGQHTGSMLVCIVCRWSEVEDTTAD